ncbi:MAG: UDP-N-acetylglucosamine 1-carboxyvinyltransferase [Patescibacteria group bacterium]|nr:UDP-N-acetylglucosamine 1-carboxyvinyltransferase [Patescibacteria group bacterium]MDD5121683.1 UDP-N-acetylglucosamine 1-carboxyvinyltransferase [Patescibacteria group bacterium]MDD5222084.1 UDP-N-acetylglucosamine 1-carboxyvinyltransferase [Patescibacteria group bacterium]MDD5396153.1 UDP-N-acetylglucosamine 1-carboxyvinyltransferase [Patescibacteria group bacterium]
MAQFIINGGQHLKGEIEVMGMKNAATPILAATLLTKQTCILKNIPNISDVRVVIDILKSLGSRIEAIGEHAFKIDNSQINPQQLDEKSVRHIRSSVLFMGPLLARFGQVELPEPGGCIIGNRPLDTHLYALEHLGAQIAKKDRFYGLSAKHLKGAVIILPEFSVTATENLLMAATLAEGRTIIKLAAAEPHVQDLCNFLQKMGAKISGIGTHTLVIDGVKELKGTEHTIIPDQIEAGTFAAMAVATRGEMKIKNINPEHLEIILLKLKQIGAGFEVGPDYLNVFPANDLKAFKLQALPYPGFPTDLQSPFGVLATQGQGTTLIQDPLFEGRMGYVNELIKMGANAIIADPHRVIITGPTPLYGQDIKTLDLRAGATLIIASLIANGQSTINQAEIIDRGYEKIEERLLKLGAEIKRVS